MCPPAISVPPGRLPSPHVLAGTLLLGAYFALYSDALDPLVYATVLEEAQHELGVPFMLVSILGYLGFRELALHMQGDINSLVHHSRIAVRALRSSPVASSVVTLNVLRSCAILLLMEFGPLWLVGLGPTLSDSPPAGLIGGSSRIRSICAPRALGVRCPNLMGWATGAGQ